jgi:glycosyltransferase involved in cell wall biosynthesis
MNTISYAVTTHNEGSSIKTLLTKLKQHKRNNDELVILDDFSTDITTTTILNEYKNLIYYKKFNKNFSAHKNYLNSLCSCDYIFQFDGDETPTDSLLNFCKKLIEIRHDIDLFWIPRDNRLYDIKMDMIKKWKWSVDNVGRINYPDYQGRLYRNSPNIKWIKPVHETISGHKKSAVLQANSDLDILHHRHMDHQIKSLAYYDKVFG